MFFVSSFAMFVAGRGFEQIRNSIGYPHLNVKIGATHAGLSVGEDGASHQCCEDIALMRSIPGMVVLSPADDVEARAAVIAAYNYQGPVYLRFSRLATPVFHDPETYEFQIGKGEKLTDGYDIAVISTGLMTNEALRAAVLAKRQGLNVRVINMPTIKPIDEEIILTAARECGRIITVEEHSIIGGLGEAVCSVVSEKLPVPVRRIGVMDQFGHSGPANEVLRDYGLTADNIVNVIRDIVRPDAKADFHYKYNSPKATAFRGCFCRGEHRSPVNLAAPCTFRVDASIDPYTVGADSISAREPCGRLHILRANKVPPASPLLKLLHPEYPCPAGLGRGQADARVLKDHCIGGRNAEMLHRPAIPLRVGLLLFHVLSGHDQAEPFPQPEMLQHLGSVLLAAGGHAGQVMPGGAHRFQNFHQCRVRAHRIEKVTVQRLFPVMHALHIGGARRAAHQRRQEPCVMSAVAALGVIFIGHGKAQLLQRRAVGCRVGRHCVQQGPVQIHANQHSVSFLCSEKSATSLASMTSPA